SQNPINRGSLAIQRNMILLLPMTCHAVNDLFVTNYTNEQHGQSIH
ncbi:hypothetical protein D021_2092B, partial [Vibrio parahaemolyticus 10296]